MAPPPMLPPLDPGALPLTINRPPMPPPPLCPKRPRAVEDTPPPPPPPPPCDRPFAMPLALQRLGNKKGWDAVCIHLTTRASCPLVLHGPTGCGKTAGLTCLLEAMRLRPVFLDAVEADDVLQLVMWIKRARDSGAVSTDERRRAVVVVDDVEGFGSSERALDALATLSRDNAPGRNPLVFVLHNARDPKWKRFSTLPTYRLFAPNQHVASEWFHRHHEWTTSDADGVVTRRKGFSQACSTPPDRCSRAATCGASRPTSSSPRPRVSVTGPGTTPFRAASSTRRAACSTRRWTRTRGRGTPSRATARCCSTTPRARSTTTTSRGWRAHSTSFRRWTRRVRCVTNT